MKVFCFLSLVTQYIKKTCSKTYLLPYIFMSSLYDQVIDMENRLVVAKGYVHER